MTDDAKKPSLLKPIKEFFGLKDGQRMTEFANEYRELTDGDKTQLAEGIENSTLDYQRLYLRC